MKFDGQVIFGWFWTFSDEVATFGMVDGTLKGVMKVANSGWRFTISPDTLAHHKADVIVSLARAFAHEKINFAYPTQTTFTAAPDGTMVMPWAPPAKTK